MDASQLAALSDSDLFGKVVWFIEMMDPGLPVNRIAARMLVTALRNVANSGWARSESEDERENRVESAVDAMSDLFDWLVDG